MSVTQRSLDRRVLRKRLVELKGGKCVKCGETENLHFDHTNRETKSFSISPSLDKKLEDLLVELEKCQLLCASCHGIKTAIEDGKQQDTHGTAGFYANHKCRCSSCKSAWTYYIRDYRRRKKLTAPGHERNTP